MVIRNHHTKMRLIFEDTEFEVLQEDGEAKDGEVVVVRSPKQQGDLFFKVK